MGSCSKPSAATQDAELLIVRALDDMLVAHTIHDRKKLTVEAAASGIVAALAEAGLVIVPREPTVAMAAHMRDVLPDDSPPTRRWHWIWYELIKAATK